MVENFVRKNVFLITMLNFVVDNERMRMCYNCLQKRLGELEKEQENSKEEQLEQDIANLENKSNRDELDEEHLVQKKEWLAEIKGLQNEFSEEKPQSL
ncbi:5555_t:CDS:2 [Funneliformis geosporum]|uniref:5555_t:CDS:1 n=1 Tax=Funneliformis geosporum TaxID=1117311 RepID=A0A9W4WHE9_9GLOM|nr:5555_t:CDS:2 [Funneliformis geosporum]